MTGGQRHRIRALDASVVGQIAAGEVVERPAFAIKELLENSIDAGATAITVEMEDGGIPFFRVTDNGCGIAPEDVRLAFMRHATSKLRTAEELASIHTLGFRGEALAAIAAVSRVTLTTRQMGAESGVKVTVSGGVIESIQEAASPEGTSITVRDLFYNMPARQKFLKKPQTEAGLISDLVMRLILARPDIAIRLKNGERQVYLSPGNGKLRDAMFCVFGREVVDSLIDVSGSAAGCAVKGLVGVGEAARASRAMQTFLLNGRYVRSQILSQALEEGCRERVMIGKYPICALHLTMPFEAVDVNVHPNKLEVRFRDERGLQDGIAGIVRSALYVEPPLKAAPRLFPKEAADQTAPFSAPPTVSRAEEGGIPKLPPLPHSMPAPPLTLRQSAGMPRPMAEIKAPEPEQIAFAAEDVPATKTSLRVIGVAWLEYAFAQMGDTLYIIDQHAAHERLLYERFKEAFEQEAASQLLLTPQVVQLTHREHGALMASQEDLRAVGFDMEDFGDRAIQVRAVPLILGVPHIKGFFGELADCLSEYRALPTETKRRDRLVKLACRKAVKAGDPLPLTAIERLIEELQASGVPPTCPHGRPIVIQVPKVDLDKRFRRIV